MSASERHERPDPDNGDALSGVLAVLRRRWPIVLGIVLVCVAVAAVRHERATKSYAATASVAFQSGTLPDAALQVFTSGNSEPQREANTEVLIAHSLEVAEGVRQQLRTRASAEELLRQVKVEAAPSADVLDIGASTGDAGYSARLANAFAQQYIAFKARSELAGISAAQASLQQQIAALPAGSAERAAGQRAWRRLGEVRAVAGGGASSSGRATAHLSPSDTSL